MRSVWYGPKIKKALLTRHVSKGFVTHFDAQGEVIKARKRGLAATIEWWPAGSMRADIVSGIRPRREA